MNHLIKTIAQRFFLPAVGATLVISTPVWAQDVPSMNVSCLCYEASSKTYKAFMLIDDESRSAYEALIVTGKISLRKKIKLFPGICTPEDAEKSKLTAYKCTPDMYVSKPVIVQIKSTSSIPLTDDANGKEILDMEKWAKRERFGIYGKKPD